MSAMLGSPKNPSSNKAAQFSAANDLSRDCKPEHYFSNFCLRVPTRLVLVYNTTKHESSEFPNFSNFSRIPKLQSNPTQKD